MKKTNRIFYVIFFLLCTVLLATATVGCKDSEDNAPQNIEEMLLGYWIGTNINGVVGVDADGYGWGFMIETSGATTVVRLDVGASTMVDNENGAMFTITRALNGTFDTDDGQQGTYTLGTIVSSQEAIYPFLTLTLGGETNYYIKLTNLDGSSATIDPNDIQDTDIQDSDSPLPGDTDSTTTNGIDRSELLMLEGEAYINDVTINDADLYVGNSAGEIVSLPVVGGNPTVEGTLANGIDRLELSGTQLIAQTNEILYIGMDYGNMTMVTEEAEDFGFNDTHLFWIPYNGTSLMTVPRSGGTPSELAPVGEYHAHTITADDTQVFYATNTELFSVDVTGGEPQVIYTAPDYIGELAVQGDWIYMSEPSGSISKIRLDGSDYAVLYTKGTGFQPNITELFMTPNALYALVKTKAGCAPTDILRIDLNTDETELLLEGQDCIFGLAANNDAVYFSTSKPTDTRGPLEPGVYRLPLL